MDTKECGANVPLNDSLGGCSVNQLRSGLLMSKATHNFTLSRDELLRLFNHFDSECERLRKDAERYRWLRDNCLSLTYTTRPGEETASAEVETPSFWIRRKTLDAVTDAAMTPNY